MTESKRPTNLPPGPNALWDWLEKRRLNQREAARLLYLPHTTVNHYLHNRRCPGLAHADRIFQVTGIPAALWLDTTVGKSRKRYSTQAKKSQHLQTGNVYVR